MTCRQRYAGVIGLILFALSAVAIEYVSPQVPEEIFGPWSFHVWGYLGAATAAGTVYALCRFTLYPILWIVYLFVTQLVLPPLVASRVQYRLPTLGSPWQQVVSMLILALLWAGLVYVQKRLAELRGWLPEQNSCPVRSLPMARLRTWWLVFTLSPIAGAVIGTLVAHALANAFDWPAQTRAAVGLSISMMVPLAVVVYLQFPRGFESRRQALKRYVIAVVPTMLMFGSGTFLSVIHLEGPQRGAGILVSFLAAIGLAVCMGKFVVPPKTR
jgi:hypothetical protein